MRQVRRRFGALAVAGGVALAHLWLAGQLADSRIGSGSRDPAVARLRVAFVHTLQPSAATPVRSPLPRLAPPMALAGVAPLLAPPLPRPADLPPLDPLAPPPEALAAALELGERLPAFEWPPSTRLSYTLTGHYRGPVEGSAQVEWLRRGTRYQVQLDVVIGASFAPLIKRQMSSDGQLGPDGLSPQRYDETTTMVWREARRASLRFEPGRVLLPGGREAARPDGVQDAVSQFVQFSWRFTIDPSLLQAGRVLEMPLALPSQVRTWTYDVRAAETLWTRAGPVEAVRLQPRQPARRGGDLVAEAWYAPSLQYLPVRILIRQDEQTFIDLLIDRLPLQAEAPAGR